MATLIPKLSLTSQDYLTDPLNLETSYRADGIADPKEFSTRSLSTASTTTLMPTNSYYSYFYIKVLSGAAKTNYVTLTIGALFTTKVRINEFVFLPLDNTQIVKAQSILGKCKIEYGYWSRAGSGVY
tara:strand:- start:593 stop:973 length:381 start_codon:yes stop_codon:yes gene_type:complete